MSQLREALKLAVQNLPTPVRMRAQNAFDGFDRARSLLQIDREIASFRAITAEEEAAAALFVSLKYRGYPGSEKLSLYSHQHKAALWPFFDAVKLSFVRPGQALIIRVTVHCEAPSVDFEFPLDQFGVKFPDGKILAIKPVEPLGMLGGRDDGSSPADFFDKHIAQVASAVNVTRIQNYINDQANARNKLLYASDSALPSSKVTEEAIAGRQRRADIALLLSIAVIQVNTHQNMALQCLAAFLKMMGKALAQEVVLQAPEPDVVIKPKDS